MPPALTFENGESIKCLVTAAPSSALLVFLIFRKIRIDGVGISANEKISCQSHLGLGLHRLKF